MLAALLPKLAQPSARVALGPGDDAALLRIGGETWAATTDMLVENVHFRRRWSPGRDLGHKTLAVNLSDLAAMGDVEPGFCLVSAGLTPGTPVSWVKEFYAGFRALARRAGVAIVGGDTVRADKLTFSVAILGRLQGEPFRRDGARAGDRILVTGTLGDAAAGLRILERGAPRGAAQTFLVRRFRRPSPRAVWARRLARSGVRAGLDISDGFWRSLRLMCGASGMGARVAAERLPVSPALRKWSRRPVDLALSGGEDYELMLAASPSAAKRLAGESWLRDVGEIRPRREGITIFERGKKREAPSGHEHFDA